MAQSPSGPATKVQLTLNGQGADPATMPKTEVKPKEKTPTTEKTQTTSVPDTGFSSKDASVATPFFIGGTILLIASIATLGFLTLNHKKHSKKSLRYARKGFQIKNPSLLLKRLGLFGGVFALVFVALSAIIPNFYTESDNSAFALETANALAIATGSSQNNNILPMSATLSDTPTMTISSETVKVTSSTSNGYTLYLSTDGTLDNSLYMNGEASRGYILPTAGTPSSRTSLELNHWGFAVNIDNTTAYRNSANWAAIPNYGNEAIIKQTSSATPANDVTTVFYGALVNNAIPAGDYFNTVIYTAIANLNSPRRVQSVAPKAAPIQEAPQETPVESQSEQSEPTAESVQSEEPVSTTPEEIIEAPQAN